MQEKTRLAIIEHLKQKLMFAREKALNTENLNEKIELNQQAAMMQTELELRLSNTASTPDDKQHKQTFKKNYLATIASVNSHKTALTSAYNAWRDQLVSEQDFNDVLKSACIPFHTDSGAYFKLNGQFEEDGPSAEFSKWSKNAKVIKDKKDQKSASSMVAWIKLHISNHPSSPGYIQTKEIPALYMLMADLYTNVLNEPRKSLECYRQAVKAGEKTPCEAATKANSFLLKFMVEKYPENQKALQQFLKTGKLPGESVTDKAKAAFGKLAKTFSRSTKNTASTLATSTEETASLLTASTPDGGRSTSDTGVSHSQPLERLLLPSATPAHQPTAAETRAAGISSFFNKGIQQAEATLRHRHTEKAESGIGGGDGPRGMGDGA